VELRTTNQLRYYTDSNGIVAFYEPGLMDQEVYFHVRSHGYEYPADMFENRGKTLKVTPGGSAVIRIKRVNIAERLYRITGEGIYGDSVLVGHPVPIKQPLLNGQVTGQDTVLVELYRGKLYWFWGDTNKASHPLGHFGTAGATSLPPERGGLDPSAGVDLEYFVDQSGFSRPMLAFPGPGMKWLYWITTLPDENGIERLVARYRSMKDLGKPIEGGLALYNDVKEGFERFAALPEGLDEQIPMHAFKAMAGGRQYLYLPGPYPLLRLPATLKQAADQQSWEAFTCFAPHRGRAAPQLDRGSDGRLKYGWKAGAAALTFDRQVRLAAAGAMKAPEGLYHLQDVETGARIKPHAGSVYWNAFRKRWVMILQEDRGLSDNGEIWYAEADTPVGPWVYARKVVTHNKYTFYNPTQHPFFDQEGGRLIYLEGTYTDFFSGAPEKTPRYDYNQIMYRLALDDPRLVLPVPVYRLKAPGGAIVYETREAVESSGGWERIADIAFFAPDRPAEGLIPIYRLNEGSAIRLRREAPAPASAPPLFYALPLWSEAERSPAGSWRCKFKEPDGSEIALPMELKLSGDQFTGAVADFVTTATFRGNTLDLHAKGEDEAYTLTARLDGDRLTGKWKKDGTAEQGTWEAARVPPPKPSPAVVPLYEYRRAGSQAAFYSTNAALRDPALKRSAQPLCRVWRNPMSLVILDRHATPVN